MIIPDTFESGSPVLSQTCESTRQYWDPSLTVWKSINEIHTLLVKNTIPSYTFSVLLILSNKLSWFGSTLSLKNQKHLPKM